MLTACRQISRNCAKSMQRRDFFVFNFISWLMQIDFSINSHKWMTHAVKTKTTTGKKISWLANLCPAPFHDTPPAVQMATRGASRLLTSLQAKWTAPSGVHNLSIEGSTSASTASNMFLMNLDRARLLVRPRNWILLTSCKLEIQQKQWTCNNSTLQTKSIC